MRRMYESKRTRQSSSKNITRPRFFSPLSAAPVAGDTKNIAKTAAHLKLEQWESQRLYSSPYYYGPIDRRSVLWRVRVGEDQRKCARLRGRWNSDGIDWTKHPDWTFISELSTLFSYGVLDKVYNHFISLFEKLEIFPELSCTFFAMFRDKYRRSRQFAMRLIPSRGAYTGGRTCLRANVNDI